MILNYKYRLYPTPEQAEKIKQTIGCVRFVYNWALDIKIKDYEVQKEKEKKDRKYISIYDIQKQIPELKNKYPFLKEAISSSLIKGLSNLDVAFKNFFRGIKKGENIGYPKFKSKYGSSQTMGFHQAYVIEDNFIKVPKIGWVEFRKHREWNGVTKSITISRTNSEKFYITITVDDQKKAPVIPEFNFDHFIAADIGVINDFTFSDGTCKVSTLPNKIDFLNKKLKRKQKNLSKKEKGSENYKKAKVSLAIASEKISFYRDNYLKNNALDFLNYLIGKSIYSVAIQKYDVKSMQKKEKAKKGAEGTFLKNGQKVNKIKKRKTLDSALGKKVELIKKLCERYGVSIIELPVDIKTNNLCSVCGHENEEVVLNSNRLFKCEDCGAEVDIDINRAINLKNIVSLSCS